MLGTLGVLVAVVYLVAKAGVPLYDGIGFPDEPYRFMPPHQTAQQHGAATAAEVTADVSGGTTGLVAIASIEQGPQVAVAIAGQTITAPTKVHQLTLRAAPLTPDKQPADGKITGNVYRLTATSASGTVGFKQNPDSPSYINLRLPQSGSTAQLIFEYRQKNSWKQISIAQVGADIYEAPVEGFGDYALVNLSGGSNSTGSGFFGSALFVTGIILGVLLVVVVIAILRIRRASAGAAHDSPKVPKG